LNIYILTFLFCPH